MKKKSKEILIHPFSVVIYPDIPAIAITFWLLVLKNLMHIVASAGPPVKAKCDEKWHARWTEATHSIWGF